MPEVCSEQILTRNWTGEFLLAPEFCLRWLRETPHGMCRNPLPIRFPAGSRARVSLQIAGPLETRVRRERSRLLVELIRGGGAPPGVRVQTLNWQPPARDPLLAALLGVHPLEWFRDAVIHTGMRERVRAARNHDVPIELIEQLREAWEPLTLEQEAAAWIALAGGVELARGLFHGRDDLARLASDLHAYAQRMLHRDLWPAWAHGRIRDYLGEAETVRLPVWRRIRGRLHAKAGEALAQLIGEDAARYLRAARPGQTLARAEFSLDRGGLARYRAAVEGSLRGFHFAGLLPERPCVEIELPFRSRHEIRSATDLFSEARIGIEAAGRVVAACGDARDGALQSARRTVMLALGGEFGHQNRRWDTAASAIFTHRRQFTARGGPRTGRGGFDRLARALGIADLKWPSSPGEVTLTVELPGHLFQAWTSIPPARDPRFAEAFGRVSLQLQRFLRLWLPALWFGGPGNYKRLATAYPLVAYQATPLIEAGPNSGFTYDTTLPARLTQARRAAALALPQAAAAIAAELKSRRRDTLAHLYAPDAVREIARQARCGGAYAALLRGEGFLMDEIIGIAARLREIHWALASASSAAGRLLNQAAGETAHSLHRRLANLVRGFDASPLAPLILMEATCALSGSTLRDQARVLLTLESECGVVVWTNGKPEAWSRTASAPARSE